MKRLEGEDGKGGIFIGLILLVGGEWEKGKVFI